MAYDLQSILSQGNAAQAKYQGQANQATRAYNTEHAQAGQANQAYKSFVNQEQTGQQMYQQALGQAQQQVGYDPNAARMATQNLIHGQSALNQINADASRGVGGTGMTASQAAAMYGSQIQPVQQGISNANNAVGAYNNMYQNVLSQAGTQTQTAYQQQTSKAAALSDVYKNASAQAAQSQANMQAYSQLAAQQGRWTQQNASDYVNAQASWKSAQAAMASAGAAITKANADAALAAQQTRNMQMKNNQLAAIPKVDQMLQQGYSWQAISKQTGQPLGDIKRYSQANYPGYGISSKPSTSSSKKSSGSNVRAGLPTYLNSKFGI